MKHQFTREQIFEIADRLSRLGSKDTEFAKATSLYGTDIMTIVQDGTNKQVDMTTLFAKILSLVDPESEVSLEGLLRYWDGTSDDYEALTEYSDNTLYCIKETGASAISKLYKGSVPIRLIAYVQPTFTDFYLMDNSGKIVDVDEETTYNVTKIHVHVTNKACITGSAKLWYDTNVAGYQILLDTVDLGNIVNDIITLDEPVQITLKSGKSASFFLNAVDEQSETITSNYFNVKCNYASPAVSITGCTLKNTAPTVSTTMKILDTITVSYSNSGYLDKTKNIAFYATTTDTYPDTATYSTPIYSDGAFKTTFSIGGEATQKAIEGIIQGATVKVKVVVTSTTGDEFYDETEKTIGYSVLDMSSFTVSSATAIDDLYIKSGSSVRAAIRYAIGGFTNYENARKLEIYKHVNSEAKTCVASFDLVTNPMTQNELTEAVAALSTPMTFNPSDVVKFTAELTGLYGSATSTTQEKGSKTYYFGMWRYEKTALTLAYVGGSSIAATGGSLTPTLTGGTVSKVYYDYTGAKVNSEAQSCTTIYTMGVQTGFTLSSADTGIVVVANNDTTSSRSTTVKCTKTYASDITTDLGEISAQATLSQKGKAETKTATFTLKYSRYAITDVIGATTFAEALEDSDYADSINSGTQTSANNATTITLNIPDGGNGTFFFIPPTNVELVSAVSYNPSGAQYGPSKLSEFTYESTTEGNGYHLGLDCYNGNGKIVITYTYK